MARQKYIVRISYKPVYTLRKASPLKIKTKFNCSVLTKKNPSILKFQMHTSTPNSRPVPQQRTPGVGADASTVASSKSSSNSSSSGTSSGRVSEVMELCYVTERIIALYYREDARGVLEHATALLRGKHADNYMVSRVCCSSIISLLYLSDDGCLARPWWLSFSVILWEYVCVWRGFVVSWIYIVYRRCPLLWWWIEIRTV